MTYNDQTMRRNGASPAMAGMVGAAIGAAVGSAATAILSDQKKRAKVAHALKDIQKKAMTAADSLKSKAGDLPEKAQKTTEQVTKSLGDGADRSKRARRQSV